MRLEGELDRGHSLAWPIGAAVVSAALLLFVAVQSAVTIATFLAIAVLLTALSFLALTRGTPRRGRRHHIGADARGLTVDGELVVPRHAIAHARVKDEPDGSHAVIIETRRWGAPRIIRVASARLAQALADTLEYASRDVTQFDALPPWAHRMRWLAIILTTSPWILFNVLRHLPGFSLLVVLALYGLIALPIVLPQKVAIGEDGVLLKWAGRRRFVPFAVLREVRATALGVELDLIDDRTLEIRLSHRADADERRRAAMVARINEGIATHRALAPAEDESLLARGQRDYETWIHDMGALGHVESGYRAIAIPRERLWAVLENPAAAPSAREGAALALHALLDDEERVRLLSIAHKSASPRLRIAIDAVTTADARRLRVAFEEAEKQEVETETKRATATAR
jgi:hypothetical protein